jgi:hypothetical protein
VKSGSQIGGLTLGAGRQVEALRGRFQRARNDNHRD